MHGRSSCDLRDTAHMLMRQAFVKMDTSMLSKVMRVAAPLLAQSAEKGAYSMLYAATAPELEGEVCRSPPVHYQGAMHLLLAPSPSLHLCMHACGADCVTIWPIDCAQTCCGTGLYRQGWCLLWAQRLQPREHIRATAQEQVHQGRGKLGARLRCHAEAHCRQGKVIDMWA